jgi:hypothetical protein
MIIGGCGRPRSGSGWRPIERKPGRRQGLPKREFEEPRWCFGDVGSRCARLLQGRANLRPRSRSASVIDRLLLSSSPSRLVLDPPDLAGRCCRPMAECGRGRVMCIRSGEPRRNFAVRKFIDTRAMAIPITGCSVRAFDVSTARRSAAAASQGPRPDGHALAGGFDNRTTWLQRSLQPGMTPFPITLF